MSMQDALNMLATLRDLFQAESISLHTQVTISWLVRHDEFLDESRGK